MGDRLHRTALETKSARMDFHPGTERFGWLEPNGLSLYALKSSIVSPSASVTMAFFQVRVWPAM